MEHKVVSFSPSAIDLKDRDKSKGKKREVSDKELSRRQSEDEERVAYFKKRIEELQQLDDQHREFIQDKFCSLKRVVDEVATLPVLDTSSSATPSTSQSPNQRLKDTAKLVREALVHLEAEEIEFKIKQRKHYNRVEREIQDYNNQKRRNEFDLYVDALGKMIQEGDTKLYSGDALASPPLVGRLIFNLDSDSGYVFIFRISAKNITDYPDHRCKLSEGTTASTSTAC